MIREIEMEIYDVSYFGTPLYQGQKVYILDGYLFADEQELNTYAMNEANEWILGENLEGLYH